MSQQCADAVLNLGGNSNNHHQNEILFLLYKECVELLQHFEIPAKNDDERLKLLRSCERMSKKMDKSVLKMPSVSFNNWLTILLLFLKQLSPISRSD